MKVGDVEAVSHDIELYLRSSDAVSLLACYPFSHKNNIF